MPVVRRNPLSEQFSRKWRLQNVNGQRTTDNSLMNNANNAPLSADKGALFNVRFSFVQHQLGFSQHHYQHRHQYDLQYDSRHSVDYRLGEENLKSK